MGNYNFYPGQRVVCVKTHSQGAVRKGDIKTIDAIGSCTCGHVNLDVGLVHSWPVNHCRVCDRRYAANGIWWISADLFRPFDELDACIEEIEKMQAPVEVETVEA